MIEVQWLEMQRVIAKSMIPGHRAYPGLPMNMGFPPHPFAAMFPGGVPPGAVPSAANAGIPAMNLAHAASNLGLGPHGPMQNPFSVPPHATPTSLPSTSPATNSRNTGKSILAAPHQHPCPFGTHSTRPSSSSLLNMQYMCLDGAPKQRASALPSGHNATYIPETGRHYHMGQAAHYSDQPDHR